MSQGENERFKKGNGATVAWYKLADLVARKEREKALNVYRLLSHSFDDKAYALQVEGDILWSFNNHDASDKYRQAVVLYKKEQRWINAICVVEHLLYQQPDSAELMGVLLELYVSIGWQDKFDQLLGQFADKLLTKKVSEKSFLEAIERLGKGCKKLGAGQVSWLKTSLQPLEKLLDPALMTKIMLLV